MILLQELTADRVESALEGVLAGPEFADPQLPPVLEWYVRARQAIGEWIGGLLQGILDFLSGFGGLSRLSPLFFWALVAVTAVLTGMLVLSTLSALRKRSRRWEAPGAGPGETPGPAALLEEWEARARAALAEGRLLDAAHALYAALILRLEAGGVVEFEASKTPGDYRREARRRAPESAGLVDGFVRRFEPLVFGGRTPDEAPVVEMTELARSGGVRV